MSEGRDEAVDVSFELYYCPQPAEREGRLCAKPIALASGARVGLLEVGAANRCEQQVQLTAHLGMTLNVSPFGLGQLDGASLGRFDTSDCGVVVHTKQLEASPRDFLLSSRPDACGIVRREARLA